MILSDECSNGEHWECNDKNCECKCHRIEDIKIQIEDELNLESD